MTFADLLPTAEQVTAVRGIEADLLRRRYRSTLVGIGTALLASLQIVLALVKGNQYAENVGKLLLSPRQWSIHTLQSPEALGIGRALYMRHDIRAADGLVTVRIPGAPELGDVPQGFCPNCGARVYKAQVLERIEAIMRGTVVSKAEPNVPFQQSTERGPKVA